MNSPVEKRNVFTFKNLLVSVNNVLDGVKSFSGSKSAKISWIKTNFPETTEQMNKKHNNKQVVPFVGLPPAEVLVGKAAALGTVDPGFATITNAIAIDGSTLGKNKYDLAPAAKQDGVWWRNPFNSFQGGSGNNQGSPGLRMPEPISGSGSSNLHNLTNNGLPNTAPLTRHEMDSIVPFRKYTFYSENDVDKFANYKGSSVLSGADTTSLIITYKNSDIIDNDGTNSSIV